MLFKINLKYRKFSLKIKNDFQNYIINEKMKIIIFIHNRSCHHDDAPFLVDLSLQNKLYNINK